MLKTRFPFPCKVSFISAANLTLLSAKRFELHPPVKKVGMKRIFLFLGIKRRFFCPKEQKEFFHSHFFYRGVQFESFHTRESVFNKKILICKIFRLVFQKPVLQSRKSTFWSSGLKTTSLNSILQTKKYPFCFSVQASEKLGSNILQIHIISP